MINKRRWRAKQAARTQRLSSEVAALEADIVNLEQHLLDIDTSAPMTGGAVPIATPVAESISFTPLVATVQDEATAEAQLRHFVHRFQHGWTPEASADLDHIVDGNVEVVDHLGASVTTSYEQVAGEPITGVRRLEATWRHFCDTFHGFHIGLQQLVSLEPPREWLLLIALTLQLTNETLALHYPHVVQTAKSTGGFKAIEIAAKLTASPLRLDVQCHVWLDGHFKIVKVHTVVGWAAALLACLGDPDDVVWVLTSPCPVYNFPQGEF
ncbi:hypothetical protein DYB36_010784 [Aphanomyces astaci]|uniref:Uncharacterized protein n=1 Tax=Aphanomyces astaci TaxID=112090 RepID=A0A397BKS2_APHAT|nr:hypothetical protein DYB36_010784 [Aphanomyces astaci]